MAKKGTGCKHTYEIKSKFLSSKRWIENETGEIVFYIERENLLDAQRNVLYKRSPDKFFSLKKKIYIKQKDGNLSATIQKGGLLHLSLSDWIIEIPDAPEMRANGSSYDLRFTIKSNGKRIAKVWHSSGFIRESDIVEIEPEQNDALILAISLVIAAEYYEKHISDEQLQQELRNRDLI